MSNEEKNSSLSLAIPKSIAGKTIEEFLNDETSELSIKGGNFLLRNKQEDSTLTLSFIKTKSDDGCEMSATMHPTEKQKKDYVDTIKELKGIGKSQKDIAYELNISPSYVSKLLRGNK